MKISTHFFELFFTILLLSNTISASLSPETIVITPTGHKPIGTLQVGNVITGYNPADETFPNIVIREISFHPTDHVYIITTENGVITASSDQLFYDPIQNDFVEAKALSPNNNILLTKNLEHVRCIKVELCNKKTMLYDITLDQPHLFFSSEIQVLTHNAVAAIFAAAEIFIESAIAYACLKGTQKVFTDLSEIKNQIRKDLRAYFKEWNDGSRVLQRCPYDHKVTRKFTANPPPIAGITLDPKFYNQMLFYPFQFGPLCASGSMTNTGDVECTLRVLHFTGRRPGSEKGVACADYFGWDVIGRSILKRNDPLVLAFVKEEDKKQLDELKKYLQSCPTTITSKLFKVHKDVEEEWNRIRPPQGCFDKIIYGVTFNIHAIHCMVAKSIPPSLVVNTIKYGKCMQAHQPLRLICFDDKANVAVVIHKQLRTIMNVGHYSDLATLNTPKPEKKDTTPTDFDGFTEHKIKHYVEGSKGSDHNWEALVPDKNWEKIKKISKEVMETGNDEVYKNNGKLKVKEINGHKVQITYQDYGGIRRIGSGWVVNGK